jgi:hypothetical protein
MMNQVLAFIAFSSSIDMNRKLAAVAAASRGEPGGVLEWGAQAATIPSVCRSLYKIAIRKLSKEPSWRPINYQDIIKRQISKVSPVECYQKTAKRPELGGLTPIHPLSLQIAL